VIILRKIKVIALFSEISKEMKTFFHNAEIDFEIGVASRESDYLLFNDGAKAVEYLVSEEYEKTSELFKEQILILITKTENISEILSLGNVFYIEESWFSTDVGKKLIKKKLYKSQSIHLQEVFGDSFSNYKTRKILGFNRIGQHADEIVKEGLNQDFNFVALRTVFDHAMLYFSYLRELEIAQFPCELEYTFNNQFFVLGLHIKANELSKLGITKSLMIDQEQDRTNRLLGYCREQADFLSIQYFSITKRFFLLFVWKKKNNESSLQFGSLLFHYQEKSFFDKKFPEDKLDIKKTDVDFSRPFEKSMDDNEDKKLSEGTALPGNHLVLKKSLEKLKNDKRSAFYNNFELLKDAVALVSSELISRKMDINKLPKSDFKNIVKSALEADLIGRMIEDDYDLIRNSLKDGEFFKDQVEKVQKEVEKRVAREEAEVEVMVEEVVPELAESLNDEVVRKKIIKKKKRLDDKITVKGKFLEADDDIILVNGSIEDNNGEKITVRGGSDEDEDDLLVSGMTGGSDLDPLSPKFREAELRKAKRRKKKKEELNNEIAGELTKKVSKEIELLNFENVETEEDLIKIVTGSDNPFEDELELVSGKKIQLSDKMKRNLKEELTDRLKKEGQNKKKLSKDDYKIIVTGVYEEIIEDVFVSDQREDAEVDDQMIRDLAEECENIEANQGKIPEEKLRKIVEKNIKAKKDKALSERSHDDSENDDEESTDKDNEENNLVIDDNSDVENKRPAKKVKQRKKRKSSPAEDFLGKEIVSGKYAVDSDYIDEVQSDEEVDEESYNSENTIDNNDKVSLKRSEIKKNQKISEDPNHLENELNEENILDEINNEDKNVLNINTNLKQKKIKKELEDEEQQDHDPMESLLNVLPFSEDKKKEILKKVEINKEIENKKLEDDLSKKLVEGNNHFLDEQIKSGEADIQRVNGEVLKYKTRMEELEQELAFTRMQLRNKNQTNISSSTGNKLQFEKNEKDNEVGSKTEKLNISEKSIEDFNNHSSDYLSNNNLKEKNDNGYKNLTETVEEFVDESELLGESKAALSPSKNAKEVISKKLKEMNLEPKNTIEEIEDESDDKRQDVLNKINKNTSMSDSEKDQVKAMLKRESDITKKYKEMLDEYNKLKRSQDIQQGHYAEEMDKLANDARKHELSAEQMKIKLEGEKKQQELAIRKATYEIERNMQRSMLNQAEKLQAKIKSLEREKENLRTLGSGGKKSSSSFSKQKLNANEFSVSPDELKLAEAKMKMESVSQRKNFEAKLKAQEEEVKILKQEFKEKDKQVQFLKEERLNLERKLVATDNERATLKGELKNLERLKPELEIRAKELIKEKNKSSELQFVEKQKMEIENKNKELLNEIRKLKEIEKIDFKKLEQATVIDKSMDLEQANKKNQTLREELNKIKSIQGKELLKERLAVDELKKSLGAEQSKAKFLEAKVKEFVAKSQDKNVTPSNENQLKDPAKKEENPGALQLELKKNEQLKTELSLLKSTHVKELTKEKELVESQKKMLLAEQTKLKNLEIKLKDVSDKLVALGGTLDGAPPGVDGQPASATGGKTDAQKLNSPRDIANIASKYKYLEETHKKIMKDYTESKTKIEDGKKEIAQLSKKTNELQFKLTEKEKQFEKVAVELKKLKEINTPKKAS